MVKDFLLWRAGKLPKSDLDPDSTDESSDEMETGGSPQEEEAKRNSLILANIMQNLAVEALKSCRLVNRIWYTEATKALFKKDLKVRVKYYREEKDFFRDISHTINPGELLLFRPEYTLEHLNYWLDVKSSILPSTSFAFTGGDLGQHDPRKFISMIGSSIKTLSLFSDKIPPSSPSTSMTTFCQLLNKHTPNLEKLEIDNGFAYGWSIEEQDWSVGEDDNEEAGTSLSLPSLKCIAFVPGNNIRPSLESVEMLLEAAPNLERLENVSMFHLKVFIEAGKVGMVKGLYDFGEFGAAMPQDIAAFANARPALEKLCFSANIHWRRPDLLVDFYKILDSSKDSLQELEVGGGSPQMQIPGLSQLKKISLNLRCLVAGMSEVGWRYQGVSHFELTGTDYPKLESLSLGLCDWSRLFSHPSTRQRVLSNITNLEIQDLWNNRHVDGLTQFCSNVKVLTIDCFRHSRRWYESIFRAFGGSNVEILNINISWANYDQLDLDSVFTGIKSDNCEKYFLYHEMEEAKETRRLKLAKVRSAPWIGSMESLKELNIYFSNLPSNFPRLATRGRSTPLLTRVSHFCAFDLLPEVKVTVGFDQVAGVSRLGEALESLSPLVNFVHWTKKRVSPPLNV